MNALRRHPWFALGLLVCAVLVAGEAAWWLRERAELQRVQRQVRLRQAEWQALAQGAAPLSPETLAQTNAAVRQAEATGRDLQTAMSGGGKTGALAGQPPESVTDAYFDLSNYVVRMRAAARSSGVVTAEDNRFGFAAYANGGPPAALIPAVFRQRQVLQYLLETLFAAGPRRLLEVRRSEPAGAEAKAGGGRDPDIFTLAAPWALKVPEFVRPMAFQLTFTADTEVLRHWLNRLVEFQVPVVVRTVEVKPAEAGDGMMSLGAKTSSIVLSPTGSAPVPLVRPEPSQFTVTLEYLELADTGAAEGGGRK